MVLNTHSGACQKKKKISAADSLCLSVADMYCYWRLFYIGVAGDLICNDSAEHCYLRHVVWCLVCLCCRCVSRQSLSSCEWVSSSMLCLSVASEYISGGTLKCRIMDMTVELPWQLRISLAKDVACGMVCYAVEWMDHFNFWLSLSLSNLLSETLSWTLKSGLRPKFNLT